MLLLTVQESNFTSDPPLPILYFTVMNLMYSMYKQTIWIHATWKGFLTKYANTVYQQDILRTLIMFRFGLFAAFVFYVLWKRAVSFTISAIVNQAVCPGNPTWDSESGCLSWQPYLGKRTRLLVLATLPGIVNQVTRPGNLGVEEQLKRGQPYCIFFQKITLFFTE